MVDRPSAIANHRTAARVSQERRSDGGVEVDSEEDTGCLGYRQCPPRGRNAGVDHGYRACREMGAAPEATAGASRAADAWSSNACATACFARDGRAFR